MKSGQTKGSILTAGSAALEAAAVLSLQYEEELRAEFPSFFDGRKMGFAERAKASFADMEMAARIAEEAGGNRIFHPGEGGLFSALWEMGEELKCGMEIDAAALPIRQETVEICEYFDLNPYYALSGGMLLIASADAYSLAFLFRKQGIEAAPVGILTDGPARLLRYPSHTRYLDRPQKEELRKLIPPPLILPRYSA
ncbi:MAG: hypothetical protein IJJ52_03415 [Lachnospiraceae bacterium]|nr:hypothetical protein [Lachnospiraceae bacterium]